MFQSKEVTYIYYGNLFPTRSLFFKLAERKRKQAEVAIKRAEKAQAEAEVVLCLSRLALKNILNVLHILSIW